MKGVLKVFVLKKVTGGCCCENKQIKDIDVDDGDVEVVIKGVEMKDLCERYGEELERCDSGKSS